jgi:predicted ATP-binding protein involved in virulence
MKARTPDAHPFMLSRLSVTNYRALDFDPVALSPLTVLYGVNGSGKTSALRAASFALGDIVRRIGPRTQPFQARLTPEDFCNRREQVHIVGTVRDGSQEVGIGLAWLLKDRQVWPMRLLGSSRDGVGLLPGVTVGSEAPQAALARQYWNGIDTQTDLPVICMYPVNRAADQVPLRIRGSSEFGRTAGYKGAFSADRQFRTFFEWFRAMEDHENERKVADRSYCDPQLDAVRTAVARMLPGCTNLRVQRKPALRMVLTKLGRDLSIQQLSDGEKVLLSLAGDIAMRASIVNPHLADPLSSPGCILIDELDLHLHPQWQGHVITALPAAFPCMQFLVATHSPIVVSHASSASVFEITDGRLHRSQVYGLQSAVVLRDYFGKEERPREISDKLSELGLQLARKQWDAASTLLAQLKRELGELDADVIRARRILSVRKQPQ